MLLTLAMFTLGVPYMFYNLTRRHVQMYGDLQIYADDKRKAGNPAARRMQLKQSPGARAVQPYTALELEDLWRRRMKRAIRNKAKNLYADFEYRWRYWKLIMLSAKFAIVFIDVLKTVFPPVVAPILMLLIHGSMLMLVFFARPYLDNKPNLFAISISFANVFNYSLVLTLAMKIPAHPGIIWGLIVVNFVLPVGAIFIGFYLNRRSQQRRDEQLRAATQKRQYLPLHEVQKKRKTIERHINEFTLRMLAQWTWGVLIASVIAGELVFIGSFAESALTPVSGHTASSNLLAKVDVVDCYREEHARQQEFLGFGNWSRFTQHCCCMSRSNATADDALEEQLTELWSCTNANTAGVQMERLQRPIVYKERQRRPLKPGTKVSPVRRFCETFFRDQYGMPIAQEPNFDETAGKLGIYWYKEDGSVLKFHDDYW